MASQKTLAQLSFLLLLLLPLSTVLATHHAPAPAPVHHHHAATPLPHHHHHAATPLPHHHHHAATPLPHHHHHAATPLPHHHHHAATPLPPPHHHSPAHAPALPPMPRGHHHHGPALPPHAHGPAAHAPAFHFPRSLVAVQGVVYCKPTCQYAGVNTLMGAYPLKGATVKLQCNNTKKPTEVKATTDEHGYFFIKGPKTITNYGAHKCGTFLVSSPNATCSIPTDLHGGVHGGALRADKQFFMNKLLFGLFTSGPFAFAPKCPHH